MYSQQVSLTSFPREVFILVRKVTVNKSSLTSFVARVHGMLSNIYLTSRPPFVCKTTKYLLYIFIRLTLRFPWADVHKEKFWNNASWQGKLVNILPRFKITMYLCHLTFCHRHLSALFCHQLSYRHHHRHRYF